MKETLKNQLEMRRNQPLDKSVTIVSSKSPYRSRNSPNNHQTDDKQKIHLKSMDKLKKVPHNQDLKIPSKGTQKLLSKSKNGKEGKIEHSFEEFINPSKPTNIADSKTASIVQVPLLYVDINIGPNNLERIVVHEGDTAFKLAAEFSKRNSKDIVVK